MTRQERIGWVVATGIGGALLFAFVEGFVSKGGIGEVVVAGAQGLGIGLLSGAWKFLLWRVGD